MAARLDILGAVAFRFVSCLAASLSTAGCYPSLEPTRYFEYKLAVQVNGRDYVIRQNFNCVAVNEWSEGDGRFHKHWKKNGSGVATQDVGNDLVLLYGADGDCEQDRQDLMASPRESIPGMAAYTRSAVRILVNPENPGKIYIFRDAWPDPAVLVRRQSAQRLPRSNVDLGPTKEQIALKEAIRSHQSGFQRVTAYSIPYEGWATTEEARKYFAQFHRIKGADRKSTARGAAFPFIQQRSLKTNPDGSIDVVEVAYAYDGESFAADEAKSSAGEIWYSTKETRKPRSTLNNSPEYALVTFKGSVFEVQGVQEIYDPETKRITVITAAYLPYPWGGPDEIDLGQIMSASRKKP